MNRRTFLSLTSAAVLGLAGPAHADFVDQVREQLAAQGYKQITVTRTMLGRSQLVASGKTGRREVILNPRTGEILRDVWVASDGSSGPSIIGSEDDDGGKGRGRGRGRGDDDGEDDNDGDDNDGDGDDD